MPPKETIRYEMRRENAEPTCGCRPDAKYGFWFCDDHLMMLDSTPLAARHQIVAVTRRLVEEERAALLAKGVPDKDDTYDQWFRDTPAHAHGSWPGFHRAWETLLPYC